ncbi:hypothetical protein L1887_57621 [Cichorium endivia]|nr:hypothetical protein L1887_57621 [Cichorium endivia]
MIEGRVQLPQLKKIHLREAWEFSEPSVLFRNLCNLKSQFETRHIEFQMNGKEMSLDDLADMLDLIVQLSPEEDYFYFNYLGLDLNYLGGDLIRHFIEIPLFDCLLPGVGRLDVSQRKLHGSQEADREVKELEDFEYQPHWIRRKF